MSHTPDCPGSGEEMVKRANSRTGEVFWGCPMFPQCDGTRPITAQPKPSYPDWASDPNQ